SEADEAALADRRIAEPLGAEAVEEAVGGLEVAAALADAFTEHEDRGICGHRAGEGLVSRLDEGDFPGAGTGRRGPRGDALGVNMDRCRLRVGPGTFFGEALGIGNDGGDVGVGGLNRGAGVAIAVRADTQTLTHAGEGAASFPFLNVGAGAIGEVAHSL